MSLGYIPQVKQKILHQHKFTLKGIVYVIRNILYGGAAGGGKSHGMRWDAIYCCVENPGCDAYLFRKSRTDLENTHIKRIKREIPEELGRYSENRNRFEFWNGSYLNMMYAEYEKDVYKYDSVEFHWLGVDEAGHFTAEQLAYLKTRVRTGGWVPKQSIFPRQIYSANPGGVSHNYLKQTFMVGREPVWVKVHDDVEERDVEVKIYPFIDDNGHPTLFIPASMEDNRYLDDDYANQFNDIPDWKRKQLVDGDWDVIPGAFFSCWDQNKHVIRPFKVPQYWTRFMAVDWGFAQPFWVGEFVISDGHEVMNSAGETVAYPENAVICVWEWYGNEGGFGMGNKGLRKDAGEIAREIRRKRGKPNYCVGGHDMWQADQGPSAAEKFFKAGITVTRADYKREAGWQHMYSMINSGLFYSFDTNYALNSCIPTLETDPDRPEDIKKKGEDHPGDGCRYGLMSRPMTTEKPEEPEEPRYMPNFNELLKRHWSQDKKYRDRPRI